MIGCGKNVILKSLCDDSLRKSWDRGFIVCENIPSVGDKLLRKKYWMRQFISLRLTRGSEGI